MDKLVTQGLVVQSDATHWSSSSTTPLKLEKDLATEAKNFGNRLAKRNIDNLIDEIYSRFPEYTVNSERVRLAERKVAAPAVYTSGYEGASIDGFLNRLVSSGIRHLVDVRRNPIARRYGFHRSTLKRLCESLDIQYSHVPELGIESEKRQELNSQEDYDALFRDYCDTTLLSETPAVERVTKLAAESPCVLVCMEAQPRCCHRSHLANEVSKRSKLPVEHLI